MFQIDNYITQHTNIEFGLFLNCFIDTVTITLW